MPVDYCIVWWSWTGEHIRIPTDPYWHEMKQMQRSLYINLIKYSTPLLSFFFLHNFILSYVSTHLIGPCQFL